MEEIQARQRANSTISTNPLRTLRKIRSRSLLQGGEGDRNGPAASTSRRQDNQAVSATQDSTDDEIAAPSAFASSHSLGLSNLTHEADSASFSILETPCEAIITPPSEIHQDSNTSLYPGRNLDLHPTLYRQTSYLALSIPSTPLPVGTTSSGTDNNTLQLHTPHVLELVSSHSSYPLAAKPISASASNWLDSPTRNPSSRHQQNSFSRLLPPLLFLILLFAVSLFFIYLAISTIPLQLPHRISDIREQTIALRTYSRKGFSEGFQVSAVLSALFVFKQAFSVPGSILVNILFGSLYGTYAATLCACVFTGVGSVLAYYMARICTPLVERFFPRALSSTRSSLLSGSSADLFNYLLLARLFPLLPYSALNIACGVLGIPVLPYFITLVLGSFPYNFVTTQLGELLGSLAMTEKDNINTIWTWDLCFKLAFASLLSAAPILFKKQVKNFFGGSDLNQSVAGPYPSSMTSISPTVPLSTSTMQQAEAEKAAFQRLSQDIPFHHPSRTNSKQIESLALDISHSDKEHQRTWSWSWNVIRNSLSNDSAASSDSGYAALPSSHYQENWTLHPQDQETGDTDEESLRDRKLSSDLVPETYAPSSQTYSQRRIASVEKHSTLGYFDLH